MTKDQAVAFLAAAGHVTDVSIVDDNISRVMFKYEGNRVTLIALEDDITFLCLQCSYVLDDAVRNELEVARMVARLQERYKVIKVSVDLDDDFVCATAEQFLPLSESTSTVFWRSVDLVIRVAKDAFHELNTTIVADFAAERFTEQLENDLHLKSDGK